MNPTKHISPEDIRKEVERICASSDMITKNQLCRLLKYLVDQSLAGKADQLKGYTIGVELFDRGADFNPNQDPIVKIHAGRLRRALKLYFLDAGKKDPVRIDIPKGKYVPVFMHNHHSESDVKVSDSPLSDVPPGPQIGIIPFKNLTGDIEKDFFAEGFTEELSLEFSKFEHLTLMDGMSMDKSDSKSEGVYEDVKKMGIRFIIEGSVMLQDNFLKVLVRLTDVEAHRQIWANRYTGDVSVSGISEVQEQIAHEIAIEVGSEYGIIVGLMSSQANGQKPKILDTYQAIYKFYYFEAHQSPEAYIDAFSALSQALEKEPESGIATAMLASMHFNRYSLDLEGAQESYHEMVRLIRKAEGLDPHSIIVRIIKALKCFMMDERVQFNEELDKCLAMKPNTSMRLGFIGFYLSLFGDWDRGKTFLDQVMKKHLRIVPYFFGATSLYYYRLKEYDKALDEARQYDLPSVFWGPMLRIAALGQLGRKEDAREDIQHLYALKPEFDQKADYLISRYVKEESLVNHILEGLRKAGLELN